MKHKLAVRLVRVWREIALLTLSVTLVMLVYLFTVDRPENTFEQGLILTAVGLCVAGIVPLLRYLWRKKWKRRVSVRLQKVFFRLQKLADKVMGRSRAKRSKNRILEGETTVRFDRVRSEREKKTPVRYVPPKWKRMTSDRTRIRYIYWEMISMKIKRGECVYANETPAELSERKGHTETEREIFELYNAHRYDERSEIDGERVIRLKMELEGKLERAEKGK